MTFQKQICAHSLLTSAVVERRRYCSRIKTSHDAKVLNAGSTKRDGSSTQVYQKNSLGISSWQGRNKVIAPGAISKFGAPCVRTPCVDRTPCEGAPCVDGARGNKQVWRPLCSNLSFFGNKSTLLKEVLVTLLELFGVQNCAPFVMSPVVGQDFADVTSMTTDRLYLKRCCKTSRTCHVKRDVTRT